MAKDNLGKARNQARCRLPVGVSLEDAGSRLRELVERDLSEVDELSDAEAAEAERLLVALRPFHEALSRSVTAPSGTRRMARQYVAAADRATAEKG